MARLGLWRIQETIKAFAGGGIELEKHHNLGVLRLGGDYTLKITDKWHLASGVFFDLKETYNTWSIQLSLAKTF